MIPAGKRLIVVLGMHRSGTSAITRALNVLGVELGERLMPPIDGNNAKGFFEDIDLNALNIEMLHALGSDWHCLAPIEPSDVESLYNQGYFLRAVDLLRQKTADVSIFGLKDPRVAKLMPFWHPVFEHCGFDIGYVLVIRNPLSVAQSLAKRDGFGHEKSYMLWLGHVLTSLVYTEEHRRVLVEYDHFLHAPQNDLELLAERLALPIDTQAFQQYKLEFLDEGLRHTVYEANDLALDQTCPPLVQELYTELIDISRDNKQLDNSAFHARTAIWGDKFNRLKLNFRWIDNLSAQITNLNQSIIAHDREITNLIRAALEQDQNVFQKSFESEWYLKKYPDVAATGVDPYLHYISSGVLEGRFPSADLTTFLHDGLLDHLKELYTQITKERLLTEAQLLELAEQEKSFSEQLHAAHQAHEQQRNTQSQQYADREQAQIAQLTQARQQLETRLLHLAEREKEFAEQLLKIQQAHEQQRGEQSRDHTERELAHLAQLDQAREQIEAHLLELAGREKAFSSQLQAMHLTHEQQKNAQSQQHAEREQAHIAQLTLARQQIEAHLLQLAEREKVFSEQLQKMQQTYEHLTSTQSQQHAEREQALNEQLVARQHELRNQLNHWAKTEKAHALAVNDLHRELIAIRSTFSWRWTTPLRSLAALLGQQNADTSQTAPTPAENEVPVNDQLTNLAAHTIEALTRSSQLSSSNTVNNRIFDMTLSNTGVAASTLEELLSYHDERFIHIAYQTLLGRPADPEGIRYYLARVRAGISKLEILAQLSLGAEGKSRQMKVAGLNEAIRRQKQLKTPVLGALLRLTGVKEVEGDVQRSLRAFENRVRTFNTQMLKGLTEANISLARLEQLVVPYNINGKNKEKLNVSSNEKIEHIGQILPIEVVEPIELVEPTEKNLPADEVVEIKVQASVKNEITREEFDAEWYFSQYPDVAKAGLDPYDHYMNSGRYERRLAMRKGSGYPQIAPISDEDCADLIRKIEAWPRKPLISILMPTYNSNEAWLRQAIDSVINQVYQNWELCIADDASPQPHVKQVLDEYQQRDSRIKVVYRNKNGRISAASNSALALVTGEFTALFDHDDVLERHALFHLSESILLDYPDIIYSDELVVGENSDEIINHVFRPMFSLELLRSHSYIVHLVAFRTDVLRDIGGFDESLNISQDYDLILRAVEKSKHIVHIPVILYRWRTHKTSTGHSQKENVMKTSKKILSDHLARCGEKAEVLDGKSFNFFETRYTLENDLRIAIIIPTKNHGELVRQCIDSIERTVSGIDYDIILIDHASDDKRSLEYFEKISNNHTVLRYEGDFNFSKINNWGVKQLTKNYSHYLLCNNDIEALHDGWLERMLELAQKTDIGIVGAKLYYAEPRTIQHAGVCVGMFGAAEHYGKFIEKDLPDGSGIDPGYIGSLITNHEMSAVTAACLLIRRDVFEYVRGFDEHAKVGFGDVDLCLRVREAGYRIIFCPHAELIHHESISRGKSTADPHPEDSVYFLNRWQSFINKGDPYYNPNLTIFNTYWSLKRSEEFQWEREKMQPRRSYRAIPN